jgi:hypothetical protein
VAEAVEESSTSSEDTLLEKKSSLSQASAEEMKHQSVSPVDTTRKSHTISRSSSNVNAAQANVDVPPNNSTVKATKKDSRPNKISNANTLSSFTRDAKLDKKYCDLALLAAKIVMALIAVEANALQAVMPTIVLILKILLQLNSEEVTL